MLDDLSRAREGFVLASDLHLVYLVTPINVDVEPDWELYYERFMELSALDQVTSCLSDTTCLDSVSTWKCICLSNFLLLLSSSCQSQIDDDDDGIYINITLKEKKETTELSIKIMDRMFLAKTLS